MVTRGLTRKQLANPETILRRIRQLSKKQIKEIESEHDEFINEVPDNCYLGGEPWIDYFERYYLAEYNPFEKQFVLTKRIEYRKDASGRKVKTGFFYQIVYKTKTGKNAPSPLRAELIKVNGKIDDAFKYALKPKMMAHFKRHLFVKLYQKHINSHRAYISRHKEEGIKQQ